MNAAAAGACAPWLKRDEAAVAIVANGRSLTVGEILAAARSIAGRLGPERRCYLVPSADPAAFLVGLLACHLAGAVAAPWRESSLSLDSIAGVIRPDGVVRIDPERLGDGAAEPCAAPAFEGVRRGDLIMLTSGSTGAPKGVALDFHKVILNATAAGVAMGVWRCRRWAIDIDMALMSALSHMLMAWQFDLPFHHLTGLDDNGFAQAFGAGETGFGGSPVQLVRMADRLPPGVQPKMMASSGDFLTPAMIDQVLSRLPGVLVHKIYGLTELGGRFCCIPHPALISAKAAAGYPLPGFSARLADADETGVGEIEARTPLAMAGYYYADGSFQAHEGGWFRTGDIGRVDPDGLVTVVGRSDDVLKVGGEKVDRHTIETALAPLLAGRDYCVLAVEHPLVGQCPALFLDPGDAEAPTWRQIVGHMREVLPSRFTPSLMYRLDDGLPRLANGKIDRETLKAGHQSLPRLP